MLTISVVKTDCYFDCTCFTKFFFIHFQYLIEQFVENPDCWQLFLTGRIINAVIRVTVDIMLTSLSSVSAGIQLTYF